MPITRTSLNVLATALAAVAVAAPAAQAKPVNDDIASAFNMPGAGSPTMSYSLDDATVQPGEPSINGAPSVWFRWPATTSGGAFVDVCGAPLGHRIQVWRLPAGKALSFDALVPANQGAAFVPDSSFCRARWIATASEQYFIQIGGSGKWSVIRQQDSTAPGNPTWAEPNPATIGASHTWRWNAPADKDVVAYECLFDGKPVAPCSAGGTTVGGMAEGAHTFVVRARDAFGNLGAPLVAKPLVTFVAPELPVDGGGGTPTPGLPYAPVGTGYPSAPAEPPAPSEPTLPSTPDTPKAPAPCTVTVEAPKTVSRSALRGGVRVRLSTTSTCKATVELRRGKRSVFSATRTVASGRPVTVRVRATVARGVRLDLRVRDAAGARSQRVRVK